MAKNDEVRPYYVLGLDPGIASCGFALLDMDNHKILEMGSHLFDTPQTDKTHTSLAVVRRNARSIRRNNERTKNRQKHCLKILVQYGLVPQTADKQWFQTKPGDRPTLKLRARGLDQLLSDRELAQVLYSLSGRRGYIPHGIGHVDAASADEGLVSEEDGKVLKAVQENAALMKANGYRTVGEMLNARGESRNKSGKYELCVLNSQLAEEARQLLQAQERLGNPKVSSNLVDEYISCMQWEKETLGHDAKVYSQVGKCVYFEDERRAANADLSSELCRAYERLGHLVIVEESGDEKRLTSDQRDQYLELLFSPAFIKGNKDCKVTYSRIRKDLDLSERSLFKGIARDDEKKSEVFIPKAWRSMRKHGIPTALMERMLQDHSFADAIGEALTYASTEDSLRAQLEPLDLGEADENAISALPFSSKVFSGYGNRSLKAIRLLLDSFDDSAVMTLTEAEEASGLLNLRLHHEQTKSTVLEPYYLYDPTCNNPVVLRAMGRMRRIVNAIIKIYGVPDEIHIELDRELKQSGKEKAKIAKSNLRNQANNKAWSETIGESLGIAPEEVRGKLLRMYGLWLEQGNKDIYTGQTIEYERMIREDHYCEIDHVLPYSRTCDDGRANKVLVLAKSNQDKRERTPYEWMEEDSSAPDWENYRARVIEQVKDPRKRRNLLNDDLAEGDHEAAFLARNLNDTRYMSRAVKSYLEDTLLFPDDGRTKHVLAVAGGATGNLRWVWGLNTGENNSKDRSDDRHHAVDAAIIAACNEATVQKVARERARGAKAFKANRESRLADTQPWPTFADDVLARREEVIPTRMVNHGVTGRAFEDTLYHYEGKADEKTGLSRLRSGGKTVKKGNVEILEDGSARLIDGMAFLRLWLDPDARPNGKVKGRYYAEPVYYADIPAIKNGTYVPRACKNHVARTEWEPIPLAAMGHKPVTLFRGDVISLDGVLLRFWSFGITNCNMELHDMHTGEAITPLLTVSSLGRDSALFVIQEDVLGHRC
ncbi:MAG: type II CRISPR RNA-guided endonuclease Cas9 [Atopobiaceae bacterium]|nr:type II CRISPR RNA-guided endonuclease Cas9 [Atopobiaceae bacterium]